MKAWKIYLAFVTGTTTLVLCNLAILQYDLSALSKILCGAPYLATNTFMLPIVRTCGFEFNAAMMVLSFLFYFLVVFYPLFFWVKYRRISFLVLQSGV